MRKITNWIFEQSPKKLAIYLVLGPLLLFLVHTVITIIFRNISETSAIQESIVSILLGILFLFLASIVLLWLFWLQSVVFSVDKAQLGLGRKWFQLAYAFVWLFVLFNIGASIIEYLVESDIWNDEYMYLIYASREFINFGGIIIAYPIVCHYAARATSAKRNGKPATISNAIPFTLMLVFGTIIGVPFLHRYFSTKSSKNSEIISIYAIAFGLCIALFIAGFIAAITGLV